MYFCEICELKDDRVAIPDKSGVVLHFSARHPNVVFDVLVDSPFLALVE